MKKEAGLEPATYSVDEAAVLLGVDRKTLFNAITNGTCDIKAIRIGRRILIPRSALDAALNASAA